MICDAHVHFFSPQFFATLASQKGAAAPEAIAELGWDDPVSVDALADRWAAELDRHHVSRAAIIASVPADESSVAGAIARHPSRFVGFFMLDPTRDDAPERVVSALGQGLRGVCLFPAMQRYSLHDHRVIAVAEIVSNHPGAVLFVHCGVLSVGARKKLGLASPFDVRFGNPLDLHALALRFPRVPIVLPHFGAGFFREAMMLADLCANVHVDSSSSNGWTRHTPGLTLELVFKTAIEVMGPDRILFGTDSSFFPRGWNKEIYERQKTAVASIGAVASTREKLFGGNFARLFPEPAAASTAP
jgi:predicted TIM-barrel fold metal-dependent hydrolase